MLSYDGHIKVAASWQSLLSRCETILVGDSVGQSCWSWVWVGVETGSPLIFEEPGFQLMVWLGGLGLVVVWDSNRGYP